MTFLELRLFQWIKGQVFGIISITLIILKLSIFIESKKPHILLAVWNKAITLSMFPFKFEYIDRAKEKQANIPKLNRKSRRNLIKNMRKSIKK